MEGRLQGGCLQWPEALDAAEPHGPRAIEVQQAMIVQDLMHILALQDPKATVVIPSGDECLEITYVQAIEKFLPAARSVEDIVPPRSAVLIGSDL
jgi:hypothetical protein